MKVVRLTQDHIFKPFDCGESDLNEFLLHDAKLYAKGLLAVTYVIEDDDSTVAFFSLSNKPLSPTTAQAVVSLRLMRFVLQCLSMRAMVLSLLERLTRAIPFLCIMI